LDSGDDEDRTYGVFSCVDLKVFIYSGNKLTPCKVVNNFQKLTYFLDFWPLNLEAQNVSGSFYNFLLFGTK